MIVGLGNPGKEYSGTRHNVGRMVVDILAERNGAQIGRRKFKSRTGDMRFAGEKVILLKPSTYMNLSGGAVAAAMLFYDLEPEEVLVVCDDVDLPAGRLRMRAAGGTGGHKGLASIQAALNTREFARIRFGIGRPDGIETADYVLGKFGRDEMDVIAQSLGRAADAVQMWLAEGIDKAMNFSNPDDCGR